MSTSSTSSSYETVPVLEKGRKNIDVWERRFNDYCISKKWRAILSGTELRPLPLTPAELNDIPAASRYAASKDRSRDIEDFNDRSEAAFAGLCKAMQEDNLLYASADLDALRAAPVHDPAAAHAMIMLKLRPTHVDAQMTAEAKIASFGLLANESVPAAIQRLMSLENCLEAGNRHDDSTLMRHIKRAVKANPVANKTYMSKVETMMDRDPPINFADFCQGLTRKFEEQQEESAQEAALMTESSQKSGHHENENEAAMFSHGKGGKGSGRGRGGKGGKGGRGGHSRSMGKGQIDARIGALYYGKGGQGQDQAYDYGGEGPFSSAGYRHNGGRGYGYGGKGDSNYYGAGQKRTGGGKGHDDGGKGGGKGSYQQQKPKFEGYCNCCSKWGHKEADCFKKTRR
jgi:hypothetical protein